MRGGGLATFNERLARAFVEAGHQVIIYTFSLQYPGILFPGKSQYSTDPAPEGLDIRTRVNSINPLNWLSVGRELKRYRPDLLVVRYWLPFMAPCLGSISALVKKNRHTRVVAIADNVVPHEKRPGDSWLTRYFLKRVHGFVTMSSSVASDLKAFGVPPENIRLCPHPLYDNFGPPIGREEARRLLGIGHVDQLLLFFGFIREYKGLDLLLRAMAREQVLKLPLHLLIAGEFYTRPEPYYELARSLGVQDRLIWHTHFIPGHRVREYFCSADMVAQPYKSATQSGVTQIAYHFEIPMLVTRVGGLPEMVSHGRAGYVVEPQAGDIAGAIADFFVNNKKQAFRHTVKEEKKRFSWETLVDALMQFCGQNSEQQ